MSLSYLKLNNVKKKGEEEEEVKTGNLSLFLKT